VVTAGGCGGAVLCVCVCEGGGLVQCGCGGGVHVAGFRRVSAGQRTAWQGSVLTRAVAKGNGWAGKGRRVCCRGHLCSHCLVQCGWGWGAQGKELGLVGDGRWVWRAVRGGVGWGGCIGVWGDGGRGQVLAAQRSQRWGWDRWDRCIWGGGRTRDPIGCLTPGIAAVVVGFCVHAKDLQQLLLCQVSGIRLGPLSFSWGCPCVCVSVGEWVRCCRPRPVHGCRRCSTAPTSPTAGSPPFCSNIRQNPTLLCRFCRVLPRMPHLVAWPSLHLGWV
jgi:hypothetical protein